MWAQAVLSSPPAQAPVGLVVIALKRWFSSMTLSSPEPRETPYVYWLWFIGLGLILGSAIGAQGFKKALGQFFNPLGLASLSRSAWVRVKAGSRLLGACLGAVVLSWTGVQMATFQDPGGLADLEALRVSRGLGIAPALENAAFAGLTPLRDLLSLADLLPLQIVLAIVLIVKLALAWGGTGRSPGGWGFSFWVALVIRIFYQCGWRLAETSGLPWGGMSPVEVALVPLMMLTADAVVVAWILTELRNAALRRLGDAPFDPEGWIAMMPRAMVVCLLTAPGRYAAFGLVLANEHFQNALRGPRLVWTAAGLQCLGLAFMGIAGAAPWARGRSLGFKNVGRMLRAHGGRLAAWIALGSALCALFSAVSYAIFFAMPPQPWHFLAADAYSHYASTVIGLWMLAGIIELAQESLPLARAIQPGNRVQGAMLARSRS